MNKAPRNRTEHWTSGKGVGVASGAGVGMIFGAAFGDPGIGLVLGAALGLVIGTVSERARKNGD